MGLNGGFEDGFDGRIASIKGGVSIATFELQQ